LAESSSAPPSAGANPPRRRILSWYGLLLILSLTLNLCAVAGYVWSLSHEPEPVRPNRRIATALARIGTDPESSPDFRSWRQEVHDAQQAMTQSCDPLFEQLWTEMAKPTPDHDRIRDLLDQIAAQRRTFGTALTAATIRFLHTLDPARRQALVQALSEERNKDHARD